MNVLKVPLLGTLPGLMSLYRHIQKLVIREFVRGPAQETRSALPIVLVIAESSLVPARGVRQQKVRICAFVEARTANLTFCSLPSTRL